MKFDLDSSPVESLLYHQLGSFEVERILKDLISLWQNNEEKVKRPKLEPTPQSDTTDSRRDDKGVNMFIPSECKRLQTRSLAVQIMPLCIYLHDVIIIERSRCNVAHRRWR